MAEEEVSGLLEKIGFIGTCVRTASEFVQVLDPWAGVTDTLIYGAFEYVQRWWQKRHRIQDIGDFIDSESFLLLSDRQKAILHSYVDEIRNSERNVRELISSTSLPEHCLSFLLSRDFGDRSLAIATASKLEIYVREILATNATVNDVYRDVSSFRSEALKILKSVKDNIERASSVGVTIPFSFISLERRLGYHDIVAAYEAHYNGMQIELPQPDFFRKPWPSWIDIGTHTYYPKKLIEKIEDNFTKSNVQIVVGSSGLGKTTLSHILGYKRLTSQARRDEAVYYIDLVNPHQRVLEDIRTMVTDLVNSRFADTKSSRVLFIIDNVHMNIVLGQMIVERVRLNPNLSNVNFLLLARPLNDDTSDLIKQLTVNEPHASLWKDTWTHLMQPNYMVTAEGITTLFLDEYEIIEPSNRSNFINLLKQVCYPNLWLVIFVLRSIQLKINQGHDVNPFSEIGNICSSIKTYFEEIRNFLEEKDEQYQEICSNNHLGISEPREVFDTILYSLSIYSSLEMMVPEEYLHNILGNDDKRISLTNYIKEFLSKRREIIVKEPERLLSFPHIALGRFLMDCCHNPSFFNISESILGLPIHEWCIQLLEFSGANVYTNGVLRGIIEHDGNLKEIVRWILQNYKKYPALVSQIANNRYAFDILLDSEIFSTKEQRYFILNCLSATENAWKLMSSISELGFNDDDEIRDTLRNELLESSPDIQIPLSFSEDLRSFKLINDSDIIGIWVNFILRTNQPWIASSRASSVNEWQFRKDIEDTISERAGDIVRGFRESEHPIRILEHVAHTPTLYKNEEIIKGIIECEQKIIQSVSEYPSIIVLLLPFEKLERHSPFIEMVYENIDASYIDEIFAKLWNFYEFGQHTSIWQTTLVLAGLYPQEEIFTDQFIQKISSNIKSGICSLLILHLISRVDLLVMNSRIIDSIYSVEVSERKISNLMKSTETSRYYWNLLLKKFPSLLTLDSINEIVKRWETL